MPNAALPTVLSSLRRLGNSKFSNKNTTRAYLLLAGIVGSITLLLVLNNIFLYANAVNLGGTSGINKQKPTTAVPYECKGKTCSCTGTKDCFDLGTKSIGGGFNNTPLCKTGTFKETKNGGTCASNL